MIRCWGLIACVILWGRKTVPTPRPIPSHVYDHAAMEWVPVMAVWEVRGGQWVRIG